MNVSIFGLGYVGSVTAACLANEGHKVIGVDISADKVKAISEGRTPVIERGLEDLIKTVVNNGQLSATTNIAEAVIHADVCLVCVGTPSNANGSLNVEYVERVCIEIGQVL